LFCHQFSKSLEEAIAFFESEMVEKYEELKPKRRGGRRKNQKNLKFHQVLCQKRYLSGKISGS
jgi:hypothetical protein